MLTSVEHFAVPETYGCIVAFCKAFVLLDAGPLLQMTCGMNGAWSQSPAAQRHACTVTQRRKKELLTVMGVSLKHTNNVAGVLYHFILIRIKQ